MTAIAPAAPDAAFGSVFADEMPLARFDGEQWSAPEIVASDRLVLHPGSHALHYGSSCFEGLKAHRWPDGTVRPFRPAAHAARLRQSAARLHLPVPPMELAMAMIDAAVAAGTAVTPAPPGSLYLRPVLLGVDPIVGAAAHPSHTAVFYVLASPVGDYLPPHPLTIAVETETPRTTPQFGVVKTGANYAMALGSVIKARNEHGASQVLFAPNGTLEETGAANVMLLDGTRVVTPALTDAFLHGVTRDSLLQLARHLGWTVEEREVTLDECVDWVQRPGGELALTGTAAVMGSVGTLVVDGQPVPVSVTSNGSAAELRRRLVDVQTGVTPFGFA
jgi:branched-chain amino acid aminotransferase